MEYAKGISIVMPCLNEAETIEICIKKAFASIKKSGLEGEVIVADNGSIDDSIKIARLLGANIIEVSQKGYGAALRGGISVAKYKYVLMGDADDSYDFSNISEFISKLDDGFDLVMGNRFQGGIEPGAMPFAHRYIGNPVLSGLGRLFFHTDIKDFHCGMRAFRKDSIEKLNLATTGMEFASEMVVKAVLFGLNITEIPCKLYPDGRNRAPHLRSIPDGLRHLEFLLIYSPKWLFAYPGLIFTLLGLLLTVFIYVKPIHIGQIQFEVTSMLYSAILMIIGFQMLQFSVFTGVFGQRIGQLPQSGDFALKSSNFVQKKGYWIALILVLVGVIGMILSLITWGNAGFGELNNTFVCKTAILFGSIFAIGIETMLFTVFSKILCMGGADV